MRLLWAIVFALLALACSDGRTNAARDERSTSEEPIAAAAPERSGDPVRGRELVAEYECNRCHDGTGLGPAQKHQACVGCHQEVLSGQRAVRPEMVERIRHDLVSLRFAPSLASAGARLRPEWIAHYLLEPHDQRPNLRATMPRLAVTVEQARDISAYLTEDAQPTKAISLDPNDVPRGRTLVQQKGCGSCHVLSAFNADGFDLQSAAVPRAEPETRGVVVLAPDLRFIRQRSTPAAVVRWLEDPSKVKPGTLMPRIPLTPDEARAIAAFLFDAPLAPEQPSAVPARLPVLDRRVTFDEVDRRVLRKSCRHCHGEADDVHGDGGPGATGGFGFAPRGLRFTSYEAISAGLLDPGGKRTSAFAPLADGTPRLVAALLARHGEEVGRPNAEVRGMPLGLPPLAPEDIQLVESWVAQGRPR